MATLCSAIKEYFVSKILHFCTHYLLKAVENNSTRQRLYTQVFTKKILMNMKQLALFQMTTEAQSLTIAGQAKLEKQSNISSNITASTRFFDCVCKPSRTPRKTSISPFATYSILVSAANSNHHRPRGQRQSRPPKGQTTRQKYKY